MERTQIGEMIGARFKVQCVEARQRFYFGLGMSFVFAGIVLGLAVGRLIARAWPDKASTYVSMSVLAAASAQVAMCVTGYIGLRRQFRQLRKARALVLQVARAKLKDTLDPVTLECVLLDLAEQIKEP